MTDKKHLESGNRRNSVAKRGGRPTKYKTRYVKEIVDYFNIEPTREITDLIRYKDGTEKESTKEVANSLPTLEGFAASIGVSVQILSDWAERNPKFKHAIITAKAHQKNILIENGTKGLYNPAFTIFVAKNVTDMTDKSVIETHNLNVNIEADEELGQQFATYLKELNK